MAFLRDWLTKKSITVKILKVVFAVYLVVTVTVTGLQMYAEYNSVHAGVLTELKRFSNIIEPSLSEALWSFNDKQIESTLAGAMNSTIVHGVRVVSEDNISREWVVGNVNGEGRAISSGVDTGNVPNRIIRALARPLEYTFNIHHVDVRNGKSQKIGYATLSSNTSVVMDKVKMSFFLIILNAMIKTVALWLFFLWVGYYYLSKPLSRLTYAVHQLSQGNFAKVEPIVTPSPDTELDILAHSFNIMVNKLRDAQQDLTRAKQHLSHIIDAMPSILVGVTSTGVVTDWNVEAEALSGIPREKAVGQLFVDVLPIFAQYQRDIDDAIARNDNATAVSAKIKLRGEQRYFDVVIYPLIRYGLEKVVIRIDDVTRRVQIHERMIQAEKMTSVGGLAAGMAHEINNPLSAILQSAQNIQRRLSPDNARNQEIAQECNLDLVAMGHYVEKRDIDKFIIGIREAGERAAKIVANLLRFSRRSTSALVPCNINEIVEKAIELSSTDFDLKKQLDFKSIQIERNYADNLPEVPCEPTEIQQVMMNLLKNSAQAMNTHAMGEKVPTIWVSTTLLEEGVEIRIRDNGPGIEESARSRVFEPFFTTKEVGVGTGLGLSVSYQIITETHHGSMTVESDVSKGATFIIILPLT